MAGSVKWFNYVSDDTLTYAIKADESNTEAVNGTTFSYTVTGNRGVVPKGRKIRTATYQSANGLRTIHVPVLTPAKYSSLLIDPSATLADPIDSANAALNLIYLTPEITRRQPKVGDTGLTDGDVP